MGGSGTCPDRSVGGFPFRIEVSCPLSVQQGEATASFGRLLTVAQVYRPSHVIAEVGGPLRASDGDVAVEADWRLLQASVQSAPDALQRASLVIEDPKVRILGLAPADLSGAAAHLEAHLRPDPARAAEGAYDAALSARGLAVPLLNVFLGGDEPADMTLDTTVTQARSLTGRGEARSSGGGTRAAPSRWSGGRWRRARGASRPRARSVSTTCTGRPVRSTSRRPGCRT
jgi:hypothetical protein